MVREGSEGETSLSPALGLAWRQWGKLRSTSLPPTSTPVDKGPPGVSQPPQLCWVGTAAADAGLPCGGTHGPLAFAESISVQSCSGTSLEAQASAPGASPQNKTRLPSPNDTPAQAGKELS